MNKKILVVAAHPDDEVLGIGGTVIKHTEDKDNVSCVILGQGMLSRDKENQTLELDTLQKDAKRSGKILGFDAMYFSVFPDNTFDTVSILSITKEMEKYLELIRPDIIYTHHPYDLNIDHQRTFQAVLTACRPCNKFCPKKIYTFETLSSTEWQNKDYQIFAPNVYINIEEVIEKKIIALQCYTSEIRDYPHPRSVEGVRLLAQYRGLEVNLKYAEALKLVREIQTTPNGSKN